MYVWSRREEPRTDRSMGCEAKARDTRKSTLGGLSLGRGERRAACGNRESFDVRLPLRRQLEELHAVPFGAVDVYWNKILYVNDVNNQIAYTQRLYKRFEKMRFTLNDASQVTALRRQILSS